MEYLGYVLTYLNRMYLDELIVHMPNCFKTTRHKVVLGYLDEYIKYIGQESSNIQPKFGIYNHVPLYNTSISLFMEK